MPFTVGGMEYLIWGLYEHINKDTPHQAEMIKLPSDESGFWQVIDSYKKFYQLDLNHFDMVISTKYPAWMVQHKNHVCYMAHRLRGLYDTYHFTNQPTKVDTKDALVLRILKYIENEKNSIEGLFDLLDDLYQQKGRIPEKLFTFPGPFIRSIVHFLDGKALSHESISGFYSISGTVKNRKEYFPSNTDISVIYPPSSLPHFREGRYDYLFTISRLDNAKRVFLMVQAMTYVKSDIRLKIAGTGPMEAELKKMAAGDSRIEFLGFVNDDDVINYYADAKAVLYMPYEEDYGLVTIEAMMSHKPVITCTDSGGPREFVKHGINGYITSANPEAIGRQINELIALSQDTLDEMGRNAFEQVKNITWESVMEGLLQTQQEHVGKPIATAVAVDAPPNTDNKATAAKPASHKRRNKKITVTSTFPIYPPKGGGQVRIFNLYKQVAMEYDVEIVSFTTSEGKPFYSEIAPHLTEIRIPKSRIHIEKEWDIERRVGIPVTDMAMMELSRYSPEYGKTLKKSIQDTDLIVAAHPYLWYEMSQYRGNKPFLYDAIDVEYHTKKQSLPDNRTARDLLKKVFQVEKECSQSSNKIITCSKEDTLHLGEYYGVAEDKVVVVPNGVDCSQTQFISLNERKALKRQFKVQNEKLALFIGSWHPPNLKACEYIINFAEQTPEIKYLLMGSQCQAFKDRRLPPNIGLLGILDDDTKNKIFSIVDVALNPMTSGSGTNLKMFDYMAAGIPVVTTEFGARGIDQREHMTIAEIDGFPQAVRTVLNEAAGERIKQARQYVEEYFDWTRMAQIFTEAIESF